jgi:hypothetical protein
MHDANGTPLAVGDTVLIPAEITQLDPGEDYCNVSVKSTLGRRPDELHETISAINTGVLILHRRASALIIAVCVAIAAATACGQTIEGPASIEAGKPVWYSITGVPQNSQAVWIPNSELQAGLPYIRDGHAMLFASTPGKRSIVAIVAVLAGDGKLQGLVPITKEIEVTGEAPQPDPFRNPYPVPSEDWKQAVKAILPTRPPRSYASDRAERFSRFAKTVRQGDVQTVRDLWDLMAAEKAEGNWPATKTAVAGVLEKQLGRTNGPLDKAVAEQTLSAVAWAIMEASK